MEALKAILLATSAPNIYVDVLFSGWYLNHVNGIVQIGILSKSMSIIIVSNKHMIKNIEESTRPYALSYYPHMDGQRGDFTKLLAKVEKSTESLAQSFPGPTFRHK